MLITKFYLQEYIYLSHSSLGTDTTFICNMEGGVIIYTLFYLLPNL